MSHRRESRRSDRDVYTDAFFSDRGGDTLEIAHLWGDHVVSVTAFDEARTVTIGPEGGDDFRVGEGTAETETPFAVYNGQWMLAVTPEMQGCLRRGDQDRSLRALIESGAVRKSREHPDHYLIPLGPETSVRVEIDGHTFLAHFTEMPSVARGAFHFDRAPLPYQVASAAAHTMLLTLPGDAAGLSLSEAPDPSDTFIETVVTPEQQEEADWMKDGGAEDEGAKHRGEEAKAGREDSERESGEMQVEGPPETEETRVKERDEDIAMEAGVMQALDGGEVASDFGAADRAIGSDTSDALGHLDAEQPGEAEGFGGLGVRGDGRPGGGGDSGESVGIGDFGPGGDGAGCEGPDGCDGFLPNTRYGPDHDGPAADPGEKEQTTPTVVPEDPETCASEDGTAEECPLSKEIIRRVVRQHRREIRYCYEQQLQANPGLEGRVEVEFTIAPSGDVLNALVGNSTLNNPAVEQCMQNKIRHWSFPIDDGKRIYEINYPFNFSSGG